MRLVASLLMVSVALTACSSEDDGDPQSTPQVPAQPSGDGSTGTGPTDPVLTGKPRPSASADGVRVVDTVATGLEAPWGLDFLPNGDAVVTERDSRRVLVITSGRTREIGVIDEADPREEAGLLGVAVSPDFATDSTLYFYVSTPTDNRVVRASYDGSTLGATEPILTGIPNGFIHDGGRLVFGPDGNLYVSTGETGDQDMAQDPDALGGKILRITPDGKPAPGNPDPSSPIWSTGHRNVQGLAFDSDRRLWASEFGSQAFDELNRIEKGANYGWPLFEGSGGAPDYTDPQVVWRTSDASPSGLAWADGFLWMASLRGERLWRVKVEDGVASDPTDFFVGKYGRLRTVVLAPDGNLWLTTSNRDGRGDPAEADDRILVVSPS
ncbi:PQQ-dependent sugar dehydrogenase [Nocardioides sp. Soil796]|uniref:PQQ-dependent sugar dehydrogenase n=1 Tax=Nocardioides sp. Soil796 TaxID=1736412 RepID=UPI00070F2CA5|nr:PQQ-dependent sugar dehydrogenase [Nocardioides sp. Soil796]KRF15723.1 glucose sorbosone dehydrogenase [Nocardioides sp. Soil796]